MRVVFLSKEEIKNPYVREIIEVGKKIDREGTISVRYGNRIVISTRVQLGYLSEKDFAEIVDYNPSTDVALVIGNSAPSLSLPLHWIIYRLSDVNAVVHLHGVSQGQPRLEQMLDVLKNLKGEGFISHESLGKISVGRYLEEALDRIRSI